jgi:hypothetical protein
MDKETLKVVVFGAAAHAASVRTEWMAGTESNPVERIEQYCKDLGVVCLLSPAQEGFLVLALPAAFKEHPVAVELLRFSSAQAAQAADMIEDGGSEPEIMAQLQDTLTSLIDKVAACG